MFIALCITGLALAGLAVIALTASRTPPPRPIPVRVDRPQRRIHRR